MTSYKNGLYTDAQNKFFSHTANHKKHMLRTIVKQLNFLCSYMELLFKEQITQT